MSAYNKLTQKKKFGIEDVYRVRRENGCETARNTKEIETGLELRILRLSKYLLD